MAWPTPSLAACEVSFLHAGAELLARMPDAVAPGWIETIAARSVVLVLPLELARLELERLCRAWCRGELDLRGDHQALTLPHAREQVLPRYRALFEQLTSAHST